MRLLTYNIFWKIHDIKDDTNYCLKNNQNKCIENCREIILSLGKEKNELYPNYDFIALQETSIKHLKKINLPKDFIKNYKYKYSKVGPNTVITLYHKKYTPIKTIKVNLSNLSDCRPYLITFFKENIIHINVHFPHHDFQLAFLKLFDKLPKNNKYKVIICGDFNHEPNIKSLNYLFNPIKFIKNKKIKTCCKLYSSNKYSSNSDIIFTNISKPSVYKTINSKKYIINNIPFMSDHLPIYSKIPNN